MLKRCIFTITDKDTGEILGWHDKEYNISEKRDQDYITKILKRFYEIPVQKNIDVVCSFTIRPPKDSVDSLEIPDYF